MDVLDWSSVLEGGYMKKKAMYRVSRIILAVLILSGLLCATGCANWLNEKVYGKDEANGQETSSDNEKSGTEDTTNETEETPEYINTVSGKLDRAFGSYAIAVYSFDAYKGVEYNITLKGSLAYIKLGTTEYGEEYNARVNSSDTEVITPSEDGNIYISVHPVNSSARYTVSYTITVTNKKADVTFSKKTGGLL